MRPKIDINKLKHLPTTEDMFVDEYGAKGTASRDEFDAKSRAWYYAEVLKKPVNQPELLNSNLPIRLARSVSMWLCLKKAKPICSYPHSL